MALKVRWSPNAEISYQRIIDYLIVNWTDKEVTNFANRVDDVISNITSQPYLFKSITSKNIRKARVTKHNSLYYFIHDKELVLSYFWDNRQNPKKNKFPQ
ncbi:MAG: type II toxin-antitoxin system RelE/ParE family toxin [Mucilaginibacter sp.]